MLGKNKTLMTTLSLSSKYVRIVHCIFCEGKTFSTADLMDISGDQVKAIKAFENNLPLWRYCHKVLEKKRLIDLERSYLDVREGLIQKLLRLRKEARASLDPQVRQIELIEEVICGLEERKHDFENELARYCSRSVVDQEKKTRLEGRLSEFDEELLFRQHVLEVQIELAQSKFPMIVQLEDELEALEASVKTLTEDCLKEAFAMGVEESVAKTLFYCLLNDGYFTHVSQDDWSILKDRCSSKEQAWLREHFSQEQVSKAWVLNDEQHYWSPLKRRGLVGERQSSGISFVDFNVKKLLNEKLYHLSFMRYQNEVRAFYASTCHQALEDGILTVEEASMMKQLAKVLRLDEQQAHQVMNQEALRIQKDFMNKNIASLYDLAMSDGQLHRDEARFIIDMKARLESEVVVNVFKAIEKMGEEGVFLKMRDEDFFVELCQLALKDKRLDECEMAFLKSFAKTKGWGASTLSDLIDRVKRL